MGKRMLLSLFLAALLTGCQGGSGPVPAPSPSPAPEGHVLQSTWLEVDGEHRFWVALRETDEPSPITDAPVDNGSTYTGLRVDIYGAPEGEAPVQTFLTGYNCLPDSLAFSPGDWNFDGHNDLSFTNLVIGSRCHGQIFYLWDPHAERFVPDPYGLNELNWPELRPREQVITSLWPITGGSETYRHYRYLDSRLTLTRVCQKLLNWDSGNYSYSVEGLIDGTWQLLFQGEDDGTGSTSEEYQVWRNEFDHHGGS